jgi:hypothetical protein
VISDTAQILIVRAFFAGIALANRDMRIACVIAVAWSAGVARAAFALRTDVQHLMLNTC